MKFILFSSYLILFSCQQIKDDNTRFSEGFDEYLKGTFEKKMSASKAFYFIIPSKSCAGCMKKLIKTFYENGNNQNFYMVINENNLQSLDRLTPNILIDKGNKLDRLALNFQSTTVIITENSFVTKVFMVNPNNVDSLDYYLRH